MTTNTATAADMISAAMKTADRSMKWTADRAGIAVPTFRRKLNGGGDFTVSELARIARALGVHPADLLPEQFRVAA